MFMLLALVLIPIAVLGSGFGVGAVRSEHRRRGWRSCPACGSRAIVRARPRPPHDQRHYRRISVAYRCADCNVALFELVRRRGEPPSAQVLLTGAELDTWVAGRLLPTATLRRR